MSPRLARFAAALTLPMMAVSLAPTAFGAGAAPGAGHRAVQRTSVTPAGVRVAPRPKAATAPRASRKNVVKTVAPNRGAAPHLSRLSHATKRPKTTRHTTARKTATPIPAVNTTYPAQASTSAKRTTSFSNWAGYQVDVTNPTQAHGAWVVPKATWPGRDGYSNVWVGLGGGNPAQGQLIQAGTEQDVVCTASTAGRCRTWSNRTYAWIETYPQRNQERITNLAVAPGDAVDVTVRWSAAQKSALFTLCNWRTAQCVETSRATSAPKSVAEFIVERPSVAGGSIQALADVGTVTFTALDVKGGGAVTSVGALPGRRIHMQTTHRLATTSSLAPRGGAFSVTFAKPA